MITHVAPLYDYQGDTFKDAVHTLPIEVMLNATIHFILSGKETQKKRDVLDEVGLSVDYIHPDYVSFQVEIENERISLRKYILKYKDRFQGMFHGHHFNYVAANTHKGITLEKKNFTKWINQHYPGTQGEGQWMWEKKMLLADVQATKQTELGNLVHRCINFLESTYLEVYPENKSLRSAVETLKKSRLWKYLVVLGATKKRPDHFFDITFPKHANEVKMVEVIQTSRHLAQTIFNSLEYFGNCDLSDSYTQTLNATPSLVKQKEIMADYRQAIIDDQTHFYQDVSGIDPNDLWTTKDHNLGMLDTLTHLKKMIRYQYHDVLTAFIQADIDFFMCETNEKFFGKLSVSYHHLYDLLRFQYLNDHRETLEGVFLLLEQIGAEKERINTIKNELEVLFRAFKNINYLLW